MSVSLLRPAITPLSSAAFMTLFNLFVRGAIKNAALELIISPCGNGMIRFSVSAEGSSATAVLNREVDIVSGEITLYRECSLVLRAYLLCYDLSFGKIIKEFDFAYFCYDRKDKKLQAHRSIPVGWTVLGQLSRKLHLLASTMKPGEVLDVKDQVRAHFQKV